VQSGDRVLRNSDTYNFIATMPIKSITYKRIKNLGNYESKTLEATSIVNEGGDPVKELEELIAFVENKLFPPLPPTSDTEEPEKIRF
jgi:hypothetical protein